MNLKVIQDNPSKSERLHYLDVAKGLLIIMVVFSHIEWLFSTSFGTSSIEWSLMNKIGLYLWVPFYMECFFAITGFCTNFNKDFQTFTQSKIVALIFPMFALMFTTHWFICAMFNALLLYYFANKHIGNIYVLTALMIILSLVGSLCASIEPIISFRRYYIFHSIGLVGFIFLGQMIRKFSKYLLDIKVVFICAVLYMGIVIIGFINDWLLPGIYSKYDVDVTNWPLHILLSISGIISFLGLCKYINKSRILEYLGRNSLVIFIVHFSIIPPICSILVNYKDTYWAFLLVLFLTLILSSIISYILSLPQISWIIGKFKR